MQHRPILRTQVAQKLSIRLPELGSARCNLQTNFVAGRMRTLVTRSVAHIATEAIANATTLHTLWVELPLPSEQHMRGMKRWKQARITFDGQVIGFIDAIIAQSLSTHIRLSTEGCWRISTACLCTCESSISLCRSSQAKQRNQCSKKHDLLSHLERRC